VYKVFRLENLNRKRPFGIPRRRWDGVKTDPMDVQLEGVEWIHLT